MAKKKAGGYYAVAKGRKVGIFATWDECSAQVNGFPGGKYQKFTTLQGAEEFVQQHSIASGLKIGVDGMQNNDTASISSAGEKRKALALEEGVDTQTIEPIKRRVAKEEQGLSIHSANSPAGQDTPSVTVYTDGASTRNGQPNAAAGWGVHFPGHTHLDEHQRLPGKLQTNNRAELMGIIRAIQLNPDPDAKLYIYTDSQYSINALTKWQHSWRTNHWIRGQGAARSAVLNRDLIRLAEVEMRRCKYRPELIYVKGHADSKGNQRADQLAVAGAALPPISESEWKDIEPPPSDDENVTVKKLLTKEEQEEQRKKDFAKARKYWEREGFTPDQARKRAGG